MAACTADSMNRQFICEFLGLLTDSAFTSGSLQPAGSVSLWLPLALDSLPTHSQPSASPSPGRSPTFICSCSVIPFWDAKCIFHLEGQSMVCRDSCSWK